MRKYFKKTAIVLTGAMLLSAPLVLANEVDSKQVKEVVPISSLVPTSGITQGKFTDFFPDPNFAQAVAEHLNKNASDNTAKEELDKVVNLSAKDKNIYHITGIEYLSNLEKIDLYSNRIKEIPDTIKYITRLEELSMPFNKIIEIPDSIGSLMNLKLIHLDGNFITSIPESIQNLPSLKELDLYGNNIKKVPDYINNVTSLEELSFHFNDITEIPDSIGNLKNLKSLSFGGNKITSIPKSIQKLTNLKQLNLYDNNISTLPEEIGNLSNLENIFLVQNKLKSLPESIKNMNNLKSISLSENEFTNIPKVIFNLSDLEELYLDYNKITNIPDDIGNLISLKVLGLNYNKITNVSNSIGDLTNLKWLYLADNKIKVIPDTISKLSELEHLELYKNQISEIPKGLEKYLKYYGIDDRKMYLSSYHDSEGQSLTLEKRVFDINKDIIKEDIIPKLILQLNENDPNKINGNIELVYNNNKSVIKLEDILSDKININDVFSNIGKYELILKTDKNETGNFHDINNTNGHTYTYTVEITDSKPKYDVPLNIETYSKSGTYKINITGNLTGDFTDGSSALDSKVRNEQPLNVTIENTKTGEIVQGGSELIEAIRVNVSNGQFLGYRIYAPAKTPNGQKEYYSISNGKV